MVNAEVGILSLLDDFGQNIALIWIIVALLIFVDFVWELFTDAIEHYFDRKHKHIVVMLEKLYKGSFQILLMSSKYKQLICL